MSNVSELDQFDGNVYQIDTTDPVLGGPTGPSNKGVINLANRARWLLNALRFGRATFAAESGTANHYVANIAAPAVPTALEEGMEVRFQAINANTGASDFTPNNAGGGIAALPIYGADHNPLQGGEIAALGEVTLRYTSKLNLGGGGAWILIRSTGGIQRSITPSIGDATNAVATMAALFNAVDGMATISVAGGSDVTLTAAQYGVAILKLTGTPTANINLRLPAQTGQWVIINNQGGAFNVTAKTTSGSGTGVVIPVSTTGAGVLVVSDGANVNFSVANAVSKSGDTMGGSLALYGGDTIGSDPASADSTSKIPSTRWVGQNTPGRLLGMRVITSSGTYTPTSGTTSIVVEGVGGGGAGGGVPAAGGGNSAAGGGGGAGAYGRKRITSGFSGASVTIGAGGTGGAGANGGSGGSTSFASVLTLPGGVGGNSGTAAAAANISASGGGSSAPTGADTGFQGESGAPGATYSASVGLSGRGGVSPLGSAGAGVGANGATASTGVVASGYGAGGGGALGVSNGVSAAGGAGAPGVMIIWEYA